MKSQRVKLFHLKFQEMMSLSLNVIHISFQRFQTNHKYWIHKIWRFTHRVQQKITSAWRRRFDYFPPWTSSSRLAWQPRDQQPKVKRNHKWDISFLLKDSNSYIHQIYDFSVKSNISPEILSRLISPQNNYIDIYAMFLFYKIKRLDKVHVNLFLHIWKNMFLLESLVVCVYSLSLNWLEQRHVIRNISKCLNVFVEMSITLQTTQVQCKCDTWCSSDRLWENLTTIFKFFIKKGCNITLGTKPFQVSPLNCTHLESL